MLLEFNVLQTSASSLRDPAHAGMLSFIIWHNIFPRFFFWNINSHVQKTRRSHLPASDTNGQKCDDVEQVRPINEDPDCFCWRFWENRRVVVCETTPALFSCCSVVCFVLFCFYGVTRDLQILHLHISGFQMFTNKGIVEVELSFLSPEDWARESRVTCSVLFIPGENQTESKSLNPDYFNLNNPTAIFLNLKANISNHRTKGLGSSDNCLC